MKVQKITSKGTKEGEMSLPKEIMSEVNLPLLAQAIYVYEERSHLGLRKTKTRSEVKRTTKKVYRQKGTGGARHGSKRAPIFVGGGVALGPRPIRRTLTLPDRVRRKAKNMAFSLKAEEKKLFFVSGLKKISSTKEMNKLIRTLSQITKAKKFTFILSEGAKEIVRYLRNIKGVNNFFYKDINAFNIFKGGVIVLDEETFLTEKISKSTKKSQKSEERKTKRTKEKVKKTSK